MEVGIISLPRDALRRFQIPKNYHHEIVEVMCNAACQLADGVHFLRGGELFLSLAQSPLGFHPLGDIAGDFGEADQFAVIIPDGINHYRGPKTSAVFSHAPAFRLEPALGPRRSQCFLGNAGRQILRCVKTAEVRSYNLIRCVTFDALRTRIP